MPDGFDVRPEQLRRGAADLRADADEVSDAALAVSAAVDKVSDAAGVGSLAGAALELAASLNRAIEAIRESLGECAGSLEAAATQYVMSDLGSAAGLGGVSLPGFDSPR